MLSSKPMLALFDEGLYHDSQNMARAQAIWTDPIYYLILTLVVHQMPCHCWLVQQGLEAAWSEGRQLWQLQWDSQKPESQVETWQKALRPHSLAPLHLQAECRYGVSMLAIEVKFTHPDEFHRVTGSHNHRGQSLDGTSPITHFDWVWQETL